MRVADLRPCDGCGGPLFTPPGRWFVVVRTSGALLTREGLEQVQAAARQGVPLHRCGGAGGVLVIMDSEPSPQYELQLCVECYHHRPIAELQRRRAEQVEGQVARGRVS